MRVLFYCTSLSKRQVFEYPSNLAKAQMFTQSHCCLFLKYTAGAG